MIDNNMLLTIANELGGSVQIRLRHLCEHFEGAADALDAQDADEAATELLSAGLEFKELTDILQQLTMLKLLGLDEPRPDPKMS